MKISSSEWNIQFKSLPIKTFSYSLKLSSPWCYICTIFLFVHNLLPCLGASCVELLNTFFQGNSSTSDELNPTVVVCSLFVRSFEKIDDVKMEFSVQITFRQQWYDNRLEFDDMGGKIKYLTMTDSTKVWMPDTFFRNEKTGKFHNIIQPNLYVRIFPNGDVLYSIRVRNIKYFCRCVKINLTRDGWEWVFCLFHTFDVMGQLKIKINMNPKYVLHLC